MRSALRPRGLLAAVALVAVVAAPGCVVLVSTPAPRPLPTDAAGLSAARIRSPLRAHLVDGRTVLFRDGAVVSNGRIVGNGRAYALLDDRQHTPVGSVLIDSVVGIEAFERSTLTAPSILVSTAATALSLAAAAGLAVAIFGSCPTVYADTGAGLALQAEGFSYAIAPLLEHRDLDRLRIRPGTDGIIRLELRNEALETHFLNHVELLAVEHPAGASVLPDQRGKLLLLRDATTPRAARDRAGRDVLGVLATEDGRYYETAPAVLERAGVGDLHDWIELEADDLPAGDSVVVALRLRNSLLNTVLLYDGILGGTDAADWMTTGMSGIANALEVSRWYVSTMGLHASVTGASSAPRAMASGTSDVRLGDVGPIAFRDVALVLPRHERDARHVRIRLRFVADNWRIDRVRIGGTVARPASEVVPLARVVVPTPAAGGPPALDTGAARAMSAPDELYLETRPGQRMTLEFAPPARRDSLQTTYLIAWQGWYREWIRGSWLAAPRRTTPWVPGDSAIATALDGWRRRRATMERDFYASRISPR